MKNIITFAIGLALVANPLVASAHGSDHIATGGDYGNNGDHSDDGVIAFCLILADQNNNAATSTGSNGLPADTAFNIDFSTNPDINPSNSSFFRAVWNTNTFSVNERVISSSDMDASCTTFYSLDPDGVYYYSQLGVAGASFSPIVYNDQLSIGVEDIYDFYPYNTEATSTDPDKENSNGVVNLSLTNGRRVVAIYAKYGASPSNPPYHPHVNNAPAISLIGNNPLEIVQGSTFVDPGATSTDIEDGDLTSTIVVTGSVNASTTGSYTLTYSVTDSEGASACIFRTVNVVPASSNPNPNPNPTPSNTAPVIILLGSNPFAVATDTPFIDPGATSTDAEDGDLTSTIVVTGSVNASTTGSYTLTYTVTDSGGLIASTSRTVIINSTSTSTPPATTTPPTSTSTPPTTPTTPTNPTTTTTNTGGGGGGSMSGRRHDISSIVSTGSILGTSTCSYLEDYLRMGQENKVSEVMKLQGFMNTFENESLVVSGVFDQATFDAVSRFQTKYASDILAPWGHDAPTGYVYILTKKKVNEIYCNTLYTLTDVQRQEIEAFRASGAGSNNGSYGSNIDLSGVIGQNTIPSTNIGKTSSTSTTALTPTGIGFGNKNGNATSTLDNVKNAVNDVLKGNSFSNAAVSFLATPTGFWGLSYGSIVALLTLLALVIYGFTRRNKKSATIMVVAQKAETKPQTPIITPVPKKDEQKDEPKKDDTHTPPGFGGILG